MKPIDFMDIPFLLTRNKDGDVNVFQMCAVMWMKLVEEPARLKGPVTCPIVRAYDLDGNLRATPHAGGPDIHNHDSVPCSELPLACQVICMARRGLCDA